MICMGDSFDLYLSVEKHPCSVLSLKDTMQTIVKAMLCFTHEENNSWWLRWVLYLIIKIKVSFLH